MSDFDQRVVLGLLIEMHPAPLTTADLARVLGGDQLSVRTDDAVAALKRDGLVNRLAPFAWPTRAALRADEPAL